MRIAPAEKNLTDRVECVAVDVSAGAHRSPAFLAKNPSGTVTVLELDDGTLISECSAITEDIDARDGQPTLTGRTPRDRAVIHRVQRRAGAGLLDAVGACFHHATPGLGSRIEVCQNPAWRARMGDRPSIALA